MAPATRIGDRLVVPSSTKGGSGLIDASEAGAAWVSDEATADFSSPLLVGNVGYFVNPVGVLHAARLDTGQMLWRHRLSGACWTSPAFDGRHAYFFGVDGHTVVIAPSPEGAHVVAENALTVEGVSTTSRQSMAPSCCAPTPR